MTRYQHIHLHFLSGTGNSYRAAEWLREVAQARGVSVSVQSMETLRPQQTAPEIGSLTGLCLPTHAFTAPWGAIRFALRMQRVRHADAFVLVTRGALRYGGFRMPGMEGTAGYLLAWILRCKGYRMRGVMGLDMPSNWLAVHPGLRDDAVRIILEKARPKAEGFLGDLLEGRTRFHGAICLLLGLLLGPASAGYLVYGRFFLAKLFFANRDCTRCGLCAKQCPFGAIRMKGLPFWTLSCQSCMRCMAYCPKQAIEVGHSWALILGLVVALPFAATLGQWAGEESVLAQIAAQPLGLRLLQYPYYLLSMLAAYGLFWWLLHIRWVNRLFTCTTFTHLFRRYHEPSTAPRDLQMEGSS